MKLITTFSFLAALWSSVTRVSASIEAEDQYITSLLDALNIQLFLTGNQSFIEGMAIYADHAHADKGREVYASDHGNKQTATHWKAGDPRRSWGDRTGTGITYAIDGTEGYTMSGLTLQQTETAIKAAMTTWDSQQCSNIPIQHKVTTTHNVGIVSNMLGFGGSSAPVADIVHAGFLPGSFFDAIANGGSDYILAVTFTLTFCKGCDDAAVREIYYNDDFPWGVNGASGLIDLETIALHEGGHALSQAHFGQLFQNGNGKKKFAPQAVMNAAYTEVRRTITGTDMAGHCSIWANWPNGIE